MHVHCMLYFYYRAVKLMLLHNPESVKVTNDYLYNIIHIATLNDHRDIIPVAIEVSKTLFYAERPFWDRSLSRIKNFMETTFTDCLKPNIDECGMPQILWENLVDSFPTSKFVKVSLENFLPYAIYIQVQIRLEHFVPLRVVLMWTARMTWAALPYTLPSKMVTPPLLRSWWSMEPMSMPETLVT